MIKTKEDLLNTRIEDADLQLKTLYLEKCEEFGIPWLSGASPLSNIHYYDTFGVKLVVDGSARIISDPPYTSKKLIIADFEEEKVEVAHEPEQDDISSPSYRWVPLEFESIFDLKDHLQEGSLHYKSNSVYCKISNEWSLMECIINDAQIYLREEVRWQDEVEALLDSDEMADLLSSEPEKFLEAARVALRAKGELK